MSSINLRTTIFALLALGARARTVATLYATLSSGSPTTLAVLSQGNYESVHHLVPNTTTPVVFAHVDDLVDAVRNGSVDVGLLSGLPQDPTGLTTFSSTLVSPRAMFTASAASSASLRDALDRAVVAALRDGAVAAAARAHPPFEYVAVHTCRAADLERFPCPPTSPYDVLDNATRRGALRVAHLGPYDWGNDGDFTQTPPTGVWPDVEAAIERHFQECAGVGFERVFAPSSAATMDLVVDGDADALAPYWTVDAFYLERARHRVFDAGCTTLGYDSTFLVREDTPNDGKDDEAQTRLVATSAVAVGAVLALGCFVAYVRRRERASRPLFAPLAPTTVSDEAVVAV